MFAGCGRKVVHVFEAGESILRDILGGLPLCSIHAFVQCITIHTTQQRCTLRGMCLLYVF